MTEDTKLILDKLNAMEEHMSAVDTKLNTMSENMGTVDSKLNTINERLNAIDGRFDIIDEKLNVMYKEMTDEFKAVRHEMQTAFNELNSKLGDVRKVTETNCYELTLLKAKA